MDIKKFPSQFNGEISIVKIDNETRVMVNKFVESGIEVEQIWTEAFDKLIDKNEKIKKILILGFATGSIVNLINKRWKNAKITGVEIDPVMIQIAKDYFPQNLENVKIINQDAIKYLKTTTENFDLIILDCYLYGEIQPALTQEVEFLADLKNIGKIILINQLTGLKKEERLKKVEFIRELNEHFPIKIVKLPFNVMIGF